MIPYLGRILAELSQNDFVKVHAALRDQVRSSAFRSA